MLQLTIVGLGMVGGSLGIALGEAIAEERVERFRIIGYDEEAQVQREARLRGAIDRGANTLEEAVEGANVVVIATPPTTVGEILQQIGPWLQPGVVVTDTAASKGQILRWADEFLPPGVEFVGGHPVFAPQMEVDWVAGIKGAKPELLQEAIYCLVPASSASHQAVETISGLANLVGAHPYFLSAAEHDGLLAGVSHVPHLVTAVMFYTIAASPSWRELKLLSDPAFRHLGWPVAARADHFYQTLVTNRQAAISWLDRVVGALQQVRQELADESNSAEALRAVLEEAQAAWHDWVERRDERKGEAGSDIASEIESPGQQLMHMFIPRSFRRRRPDEDA